ncbi:unnamed protein product, partial [Mesorhabditis belari]|uniref:E3 ubiquitin-protein ligase n=1 Tax=Mesorhabditis belari TaxID=2138241 RepID=A0AAF3FPR2_9BILA
MDTSSSTQGGSGNLSLSTPELAANEDGEPDDDEDDDDDDTDNDDRNEKKEGSLTDLLVDLDGGTNSRSHRNRRFTRTTFECRSNGVDGVPTNKKAVRKSSGSLKAKIGTYADVLRSVMYQMMDTSSGDIDEMDEEIFEDETDANEDELIEDHDLGLTAGILPRGLIGKIGNDGGIRLNWRQMSQLLMNEPHRLQEGTSKGRLTQSNLRQWDDEFVLKCQFQALIPAFDPRPGRSNVNQTQDVELPANLTEFPATPNPLVMNNDIKLRLFLRGPNLPGIENKTIELCKDEQSLFKCIQTLTNNIEWQQKGDKNRRIFDPTYTILYEDASTAPSVDTSNIPTEESKVPEVVNQTLDVLNLLAKIATTLPESELPSNIFVSEKLTQKLIQELSDPLVVSSRSMPEWCERLIYAYPCLFTMDTRNMYMQATAFGVSRSIVWLQSRRDAALEKTRGASSNATVGSATVRREDAYEYRVGRLKHERMKVTRSEDALLEQAIRVFRFHSFNKAVLEIEYNGEEGTGLGPTLEFYALVSAEMQRKALAIWWCDDLDETQLKLEEKELDLGEGKKPPGYYVRRAGGLFPAPLPPNTEQRRRASELFHVLGIFLAKVLQDGRLVDIPLSQPFLKLAIHPKVNNHTSLNDLDGVLNLDDFEEVHPVKGRFLKELSSLAARKRTIECDENMDNIAKRRRIDELTLNFNGTRCKIEDLALNFTVNPPSTVFQYKEMELLEGGSDMDVTMDNVELYVEKCTDYYLNSGIIEQVRAFREGFDKVFPLHSLRSFTSQEVQCLISGEQCPEWTREDLINYTEPKLGYTRESPGFLRFVDVMVELTAPERKSFLQFATGCSSLPPGGLANLHPRLTIVRKVESGDGSYPSVNTCVHYLKLPEYSSSEILRERLLTAINEKGFHLN